MRQAISADMLGMASSEASVDVETASIDKASIDKECKPNAAGVDSKTEEEYDRASPDHPGLGLHSSDRLRRRQ